MITTSINGQKFYEDTPIGCLPSVSTILEATESKESQDRLRKWQHALDKALGSGTANQSSEIFKKLGTECHDLIVDFLSGRMKLESCNPYFPVVLPFLKLIRADWFELEKQVWSSLGYAGTLDCIADYYGRTTLIDWKTSSKWKRREWIDRHFLQAEAYAIAYEERHDIKIQQLAIIVINPKKVQIFKESREGYREKWLERLNQFKKMQSTK